jgi:dienelactone hydrolase
VSVPERLEAVSAAGVPVLLRRPNREPAPLVVLWHGLGPPSSPRALAEALPLEDLPTWKAYPCLPLLAGRLPAGGVAEILKRQQEDFVLELLLPVVAGAAAELPRIVEAVAKQTGARTNKGIGLFGFSAGAAAALLALSERQLEIAAAAVLGVARNLDAAVATFERFFGQRYRWGRGSEALRPRLDFEARAGEISAGDPPAALLILHGEADEMFGVEDARQLYRALEPHYRASGHPARLELELLAEFTHSFGIGSEPRGTFPTSDAAPVDRALARWFASYLQGDGESLSGDGQR